MANELAAGYASLAGIGLESLAGDWATLVAPTIKIPFVNENLNQLIDYLENNALEGERGYESPTIIGYKTSGPLRVQASYRSSEFLIYAALGGDSAITGASAPYTHTLDIGDNILRSMSIIIEKDVTCWEIAGARINTMTLVSSPTEGVYWDIELIAKKVTRSTTHRAALAALTYNENNPRLFHHQLAFRLADCADALATGDIIGPSDISLAINNKLIPDDVTSKSGLYIEEPRRGGKTEILLNFTLPRYEADTLLDFRDNGTKLQADLIYTGGTCGGGNYSQTINLTTLYIKEITAPVSDETKVPLSVACQCYRNDGNTNMSETEELEVLLDNGNDAVLAWTA